jgi:O-antigen ligase
VKNAQLNNLLERLLVLMLYGTTLLVLPYTVSDPINLPKMVVLVGIAGALAGLLLFNAKGFITKSHNPILISSALFIIYLLIVLAKSGVAFPENLYGTAGRNTGVATYASFTVVALACVLIASELFLRKVFASFLLIGILLLIYGIFQYLGFEPFPYINAYESNVFGTFGNPNFQSSFMGMLTVLAAAFTLKNSLKMPLRIASLVLVVGSLVGVYLTNSIQGFFNFALGFSFIVFFYFISTGRKIFARIMGVLLLLGTLSIVAAFLNAGPLAEILYKGSMSARVYYWKTAVKIALDHPFFGVGMDQYVDWLRVYRTPEQVATNLTADSAHNIYLDVLSSGGFPLFILFCSFTTLTIISIVRVSKRDELPSGNYFALVGLWVAYQAQSLISISQIGVAVWGWVFSGLLIGYEINTRDGDGKTAEKESISKTKNKKKIAASIHPKLIVTSLAGLALGLAVALPPFISAQEYYNAFKTSDARVIKDAAFLKPYNRNSFLQVVGVLSSNKFDKDALDVVKEGIIHFPNSFVMWKVLADLSAVGSKDQLDAMKRLHALDPNNPAYALP